MKKKVEQVCNAISKPNWQEKVMIVDLHNLTQQGTNFTTIFVPEVILSNVYNLASITAKRPICHYWVHPAILYSSDLPVLYFSVLDSSFSMLT